MAHRVDAPFSVSQGPIRGGCRQLEEVAVKQLGQADEGGGCHAPRVLQDVVDPQQEVALAEHLVQDVRQGQVVVLRQ